MSDVSTYSAEVGQRMRLVRQAWKLSLAAVEEQSAGEFDADTLASWERGDKAMRAESLSRYARWLNVSIRVLLPPWRGQPDGLPEAVARIAATVAEKEVADVLGHAGSAA